MYPRRAAALGLSNPPKLELQFRSHELLELCTGLFWLALSPTQKTVVTMLFFHGYFDRLSVRLAVGIITVGSILSSAFSRSIRAYFSKSPLLWNGVWASALVALSTMTTNPESEEEDFISELG